MLVQTRVIAGVDLAVALVAMQIVPECELKLARPLFEKEGVKRLST
jgi:hypothetical protein